MKSISVAALVLLFSGCSFVKVSDEGAQVAQANPADVVNCREIGDVDSKTTARVLFNRNKTSVQQELIDLARDQAAKLGANAIVPVGEPVDGQQTFKAYACS